MSFWSSGFSKGILGLGALPVVNNLVGGFENLGPGSPVSIGLQTFNSMKQSNIQSAMKQGTTGMFKSENIPMLALWDKYKEI